MKKLYSLIIVLFIGVTLYAQTDGISYQAVILNPQKQELPGIDVEGNIFPNKTITLRFTINDSNGSEIYQETQATTTDSYGLVNLFIGEGDQTSIQNFNEIYWDGNSKNLKVEIDFNGGNNFVNLGTQKLTFTPYAYHRDIIGVGDLNIDGETTLNDNLTVKGQTKLENNITVTGTTILKDDLTVAGITNLNEELNVKNGANINLSGDLTVDGKSTFKSGLDIDGETVLNDNLTVKGETKLENKMSVSGIANLGDDLIVNGNVVLKSDMGVDGETNLHNNLTVDGDAVLNKNLSVLGSSTFEDVVVLKSDLDVDGQINLHNDLTVEGDAVLNKSLSVLGSSTFNDVVVLKSDMGVDGETNLHNNLTVDGDAVLNKNLSVLGSSTFEDVVVLKSDLDVDGQTNLHNTLTVDGDAVLNKNISVVGSSTFNDEVILKGDLNIDGLANLNGGLNVTNGKVTSLSGYLFVDGITNLKNTLNVLNGSETNLTGGLFVAGVTSLKSALNVLNGSPTNLSGILNVDKNTWLKKDLTVEGIADFKSDLTMKNLVVKSDGGAYGDHVALFENTNSSNGNTADGIAIRIQGNVSNKLGFRNRFITFYGNDDYVAGRIESYDLLAGDLWESFPIPDFGNLINIFDFSNVLTGGRLPSLAFSGGALPSASFGAGSLPSASFNRGGLPSLSIDFAAIDFNFNKGSLPSLSFGSGSLPNLSFNPGALPATTFDIGEFPTLDFSGFWNPTAAAGAASDVGAMVSWGMRNGNPGFIPETPWGLALVPLVLAAKQVAMNQGVIYGSKGADYAEWLEKENLEDKFVFGEVVGVKGGKISRNTVDADQVMSISLAPIILGNMPEENKKQDFEKVGFMGQVPVLTLGDVEIGDYIVASGYNDGYAKAISEKDIMLKDLKNIIGKAWSSSKGQKVSLINVSVGLKTNEWVEIMKQQESRLDKLESKIEKLEELIKNVNTL